MNLIVKIKLKMNICHKIFKKFYNYKNYKRFRIFTNYKIVRINLDNKKEI